MCFQRVEWVSQHVGKSQVGARDSEVHKARGTRLDRAVSTICAPGLGPGER